MKTTVDLSKLSAGEFSELVNTKETHRIRQEILKICFDILADFPHLTTTNDKAMLLLSIVNTLDEYPKLKKERLNQEMYRRVVVASSFVNVALDAARLGLCGYYSYSQAVSIIETSYEGGIMIAINVNEGNYYIDSTLTDMPLKGEMQIYFENCDFIVHVPNTTNVEDIRKDVERFRRAGRKVMYTTY